MQVHRKYTPSPRSHEATFHCREDPDAVIGEVSRVIDGLGEEHVLRDAHQLVHIDHLHTYHTAEYYRTVILILNWSGGGVWNWKVVTPVVPSCSVFRRIQASPQHRRRVHRRGRHIHSQSWSTQHGTEQLRRLQQTSQTRSRCCQPLDTGTY